MDEAHLLGGDATGNQLLSDVIIDIESAVIFRLCNCTGGRRTPLDLHLAERGSRQMEMQAFPLGSLQHAKKPPTLKIHKNKRLHGDVP